MQHLFWTILCFATIIWYILVTAIVAYKGGIDVKNMLSDMEAMPPDPLKAEEKK